jgi:hypothetical protein
MSGQPEPAAPANWTSRLLTGVGVVLVLGGAGLYYLYTDKPAVNERVPRADTLTPAKRLAVYAKTPRQPVKDVVELGVFDPEVKQAYAIAKEIPEVLEKMPCYCGCFSPQTGHSSNYDCFVDEHGAG